MRRRVRLAVVDTTFARVDMAKFVLEELQKYGAVSVVRSTVPGIKDLAVECKRLLDRDCHAAIALGMVGAADLDRDCANQASLGIQWAKLLTGKHIIEVFVHESEAKDANELYAICEDRARKHAHNAVALARESGELAKWAGQGRRQGRPHVGPLRAR
ncbi:MAG: riboflavin synthase [Candidatus Micrarchaeia archaeon]